MIIQKILPGLILAGALGLDTSAATNLPVSRHAWTVEDIKPRPVPFTPGRRPDSILSFDFVHLVADDTRGLLLAPLAWDQHDWLLAGGLTGLVLGASAFDNNIRAEAQEGRTHDLDKFTKNAQRLGAEYSWLILGGFEACGYIGNDPKARAVAMDGLTASIISTGIITPLLKFSAGRIRPDRADHVFEFKPFSGNNSFPSGHTTQAFAIASVIAAHYDQWWVQGVAYGLAGVVGYSRIEQNAHFASDVVAGAVIGTVVGQAIVRRHAKPRAGQMAVAPYLDGRASGIVFRKDF